MFSICCFNCPSFKTHENLHKNVNENMFSYENMFSFTFYANFLASVTFLFVWIFVKFSPKSRTKKLGMIYTVLGCFCSFLNWKGAYIQPQIRSMKISASTSS